MRQPRAAPAWYGSVECRTCGFRRAGLFADLDHADFDHSRLPIDLICFASGSILYRAGDQGGTVFCVRSGLVKLVQSLPNGTQRIVRLLRAGDTAGLELLLGPRYQHTAVVLQETEVCRVPCATIETLNRETPRLQTQLMRAWQHGLEQADDWLTLLSTGSARARVARLLLYLHADAAEPVCQVFAREDVAAMLGITTETASRVIAEFRRADVVTPLRGNRFRIDVEKLELIADY